MIRIESPENHPRFKKNKEGSNKGGDVQCTTIKHNLTYSCCLQLPQVPQLHGFQVSTQFPDCVAKAVSTVLQLQCQFPLRCNLQNYYSLSCRGRFPQVAKAFSTKLQRQFLLCCKASFHSVAKAGSTKLQRQFPPSCKCSFHQVSTAVSTELQRQFPPSCNGSFHRDAKVVSTALTPETALTKAAATALQVQFQLRCKAVSSTWVLKAASLVHV